MENPLRFRLFQMVEIDTLTPRSSSIAFLSSSRYKLGVCASLPLRYWEKSNECLAKMKRISYHNILEAKSPVTAQEPRIKWERERSGALEVGIETLERTQWSCRVKGDFFDSKMGAHVDIAPARISSPNCVPYWDSDHCENVGEIGWRLHDVTWQFVSIWACGTKRNWFRLPY